MTAVKREFHPVADIFPMMSDRELADLVADIREHGLREPIWLHRDGRIIDGRNRYLACASLKDEPEVRTYRGDDSDLVAFVVSLNLHRRHLSESQRAMIAARIASLSPGRPAETAPIGAVSQDDAAEMLNVSRRSVQRAKKVRDEAAPELAAMVESGEVPVSLAAEVAAETGAQASELPAEDLRDAVRETVDRKRQELAKRRQRVEEVREHNEWARQVNEDIHPDTKAELADLGRRVDAVVAISMACQSLLDQVRGIDPVVAVSEAPEEIRHKLTVVAEALVFLTTVADAMKAQEVSA